MEHFLTREYPGHSPRSAGRSARSLLWMMFMSNKHLLTGGTSPVLPSLPPRERGTEASDYTSLLHNVVKKGNRHGFPFSESLPCKVSLQRGARETRASRRLFHCLTPRPPLPPNSTCLRGEGEKIQQQTWVGNRATWGVKGKTPSSRTRARARDDEPALKPWRRR